MLDYTAIGAWLLVGSAVVIVVEMALAGVLSARVARRARTLSERVQAGRGLVQEDVERLHATLEETRRLWAPYRRLLRWFRHPLVIALMQSYARRAAAR